MSSKKKSQSTKVANKQKSIWLHRRRRVSEIIEVGTTDDIPSRCYDFASTLILLINVAVTMLYTFDEMELRYGQTLLLVEALTVAFLRWTIACGYGLPSLSVRV